MSMAPIILMGAAAGLEATAAYKQGRAQEKAYNANAQINEENANNAALATSINEDTQRKANRQKLSRMAAAQGEAGLVGGTALKSYLESYENAEADALNIRYQGLSQWQNYKNQAKMDRYYGKASASAGKAGAVTALVKGAANMLTYGAANYGWFTPKAAGSLAAKPLTYDKGILTGWV